MSEPRDRILMGRRLRAARLSLGLSVSDFADEVDMDSDAYEQLEQGKLEPSLDVLIHIAKITGRSLDVLLTGRAATEAA